MKRRFQQLSILGAIVIFLFSLAPEEVESRRRGGGRSFSRSSSRRSYSAPRRSTSRTRSSSSTRSRTTRPRSSTSTSTRTTRSTTGTRASTTARQKQTATNRARTTTGTSTRNARTNRNNATTRSSTRNQQRQVKSQNRKQVRQLKSENRRLKRENRRANRETARARRDARQTININNFGGYYPMAGYSMYSLGASMAFNNLMFGIYFHDHYNHAIRHSYMWHYHHRDYDRSHWDAKKQAEYEHYKEYYESQGIEPNPNYVDPGTNRDEDYVASYVQENPNEFYGENAQVFTVDQLPDEEALKEELLAAAETPTATSNVASRAPPASQKVVIEKKTSGGTWFVLIFGGILVVGVIAIVMYNKGYF